jgi:hypothetical protein
MFRGGIVRRAAMQRKKATDRTSENREIKGTGSG